jgi:pimeloyl-ACP methyl ester carboxylesterase
VIAISLFPFAVACGVWASEPRFQAEQVILTTVDGVKIRAFEIATGKDAMLIYCHRLLSSKESFDLKGFGRVFLREFDVLALDFRGHKRSEWVSNCGGDEVLDLRTAIQYARHRGYRRIVLLGVGMGGVVAIREVALFGNADAVVAVSPCGMPERLKPWWWNLAADISLTTDYGRIPIRILSNTRIIGRYWTGSPIYLVDRVSPTPLLLIHARDDRYLNLEQIQTLYDNAKDPKKLLILPRSEHAEGLLDESTAKLIIAWLREVLSNRSPTAVNSSDPPIPISDIRIYGDVVLPEKMIEESIKVAADGASNLQEQLTRIRREVEALHKSRGYILSRVSGIQLSPDGRLSLKIEVGRIDRLVIEGNRRVPSEQIRRVLQIAERHYYNAWEIEAAVKRLKRFPVFENVENQLKRDTDGNIVRILVRERSPWSFGLITHFTDFDRFGGVRFSLNEFRSGAWRGSGQMLLGLQRRNLLYRINIEKGWFRQEALSIEFGFEGFIHSWDNLDYYFARQESKERGGDANIAYKITDNATIHLGISRKRFAPLAVDEAPPVDGGFINALTLRLENRGRFLHRGELFFNWRSQTFVEIATTRAHGDYDYTIFQFNLYPQLVLSSTQALSLGLHWGCSRGDVPQQKLFSLGGDTTLPGYDDDAFVGEHVFLLRARYDLRWGKWLGETSRLAPLGVSLLFDAGDARMRDEPLRFDVPKLELGIELNYASLIRIGIVKSLGKEKAASYLYLGWHPHLIRL